jgi:hypothetical protein
MNGVFKFYFNPEGLYHKTFLQTHTFTLVFSLHCIELTRAKVCVCVCVYVCDRNKKSLITQCRGILMMLKKLESFVGILEWSLLIIGWVNTFWESTMTGVFKFYFNPGGQYHKLFYPLN